ncbi:MAG: peptigoglycan-binding protein LysM, partial [Gammaproteobacteria bacterium]|nr:peptigoglycan-binding protein LysM [Gammaproteobacteria bacterium]
MLRKLPLAIAIALAVAPFHSQALGLGKIKTRSVLNQPFDAEIQLLSVPPGELDGVRVNLATPEAFDRAGVDRPYLLSKLRFKTLRKANGDAAIEVFSRNSIQEPYLNFLVEVNWPRGRMVREFTVLLDPPLTTGRRAAAVTTPTSVTMPASAVSTRTVQPESMARVASDGEYGPVQRNETLWTIANGTRPAGASANQMMLAILKANPQAFAADNINTLKAGSILRIPSAEDVKALSAAEATQIANQQYADWKQGAVKTVAAPKTPDTPATTPIQQPATTSSVDEEARLKLSGSDVAGQSGAGEDAEAIKQELLAAQEKVITAESESDEIRGQMEEMQAELLDLKRLLELKDRQLSQLQAANDESMATAEETVEMVEETVEETIEETAED